MHHKKIQQQKKKRKDLVNPVKADLKQATSTITVTQYKTRQGDIGADN